MDAHRCITTFWCTVRKFRLPVRPTHEIGLHTLVVHFCLKSIWFWFSQDWKFIWHVEKIYKTDEISPFFSHFCHTILNTSKYGGICKKNIFLFFWSFFVVDCYKNCTETIFISDNFFTNCKKLQLQIMNIKNVDVIWKQ